MERDIFEEITDSLRQPDGSDIASVFTEHDELQVAFHESVRDRYREPRSLDKLNAMVQAAYESTINFQSCVTAIHEVEPDFNDRVTLIAEIIADDIEKRYGLFSDITEGALVYKEVDRANIQFATLQVMLSAKVNHSAIDSIVNFQTFLLQRDILEFSRETGMIKPADS